MRHAWRFPTLAVTLIVTLATATTAGAPSATAVEEASEPATGARPSSSPAREQGSSSAVDAQEKEPVTLRLLAYNIKHGLGNDGEIDLERAAAVINALAPDLVALQEVDKGVERTGGVDQARQLGELTGMHAEFGDFMDYQGGQYGMAILSRFPISVTINHRLPPGAEPRSALAARVRVDAGGREVVFVGIHLYRTLEERLCQAGKVIDAVATETAPVILAGDFNSTPDSQVMSLIRKSYVLPAKGEDRLTFSSDDPRREIDFIAYRPAGIFEVVESRVVDEPVVSDHRPVLLVLRMR